MQTFGCFLFQRSMEPRTFDITRQRRINQGKSDADGDCDRSNRPADYEKPMFQIAFTKE
jgi:hypothetical protein